MVSVDYSTNFEGPGFCTAETLRRARRKAVGSVRREFFGVPASADFRLRSSNSGSVLCGPSTYRSKLFHAGAASARKRTSGTVDSRESRGKQMRHSVVPILTGNDYSMPKRQVGRTAKQSVVPLSIRMESFLIWGE